MQPIVLIHGYSAEGKSRKVKEIYGSLPKDLRARFGRPNVVEIDLSRWISLSDGIALDDISFALERALRSRAYRSLLDSGFHVVIHSTGALVIRNWLRLFGEKPAPVANLVHLAGANFGSGLAHIGQGQLVRWGREIFQDVESGVRVLSELELGATKTLDLHLGFLESGRQMSKDYGVREFCMIGSQSSDLMQLVPIRYVKEDSADGVVRTSAGNLNFNHIRIAATRKGQRIGARRLEGELKRRLANEVVAEDSYEVTELWIADEHDTIPFVLLYETSHSGGESGIVAGTENRGEVLDRIEAALRTEDEGAYRRLATTWATHTENVLVRAAELKRSVLDWSPQKEYEGHSQLVFRIRDQYEQDVEHHEITFRSEPPANRRRPHRLERMIEDVHVNRLNPGTATYYLRTQRYRGKDAKKRPRWVNQLNRVAPVRFEISGFEPQSEEIRYVPLNVRISGEDLARFIQPFRTTVIDVVLQRLPSEKVFELTRYRSR